MKAIVCLLYTAECTIGVDYFQSAALVVTIRRAVVLFSLEYSCACQTTVGAFFVHKWACLVAHVVAPTNRILVVRPARRAWPVASLLKTRSLLLGFGIRAQNTDIIFDIRFRGRSSRAPVRTILWTRPVHTGARYRLSVFTARWGCTEPALDIMRGLPKYLEEGGCYGHDRRVCAPHDRRKMATHTNQTTITNQP